MRRVAAYPWEALAILSRRAIRNAERVRRAISPLPSLERLAEASSELLSAEVRIELTRPAAPRTARPTDAVFLETEEGSTALAIELEPALVTLVLARILGRRHELTSPSAPLDDVARGALSAVIVEVARRAFSTTTLRARPAGARGGDAPTTAPPAGAPPGAAPHDGARVDVTIFVDERPYHAALHAVVDEGPNAVPGVAPDLDSFAGLPLELRVVAALSTATRLELAALCTGDVWLPGAGWLGMDDGSAEGPSRRVLGRAALSSPEAELGVEVGRSEDGRLVLRGGIIALGADVTDTEARRGGGDDAMSGPEETLTELVLEAPVVVRVEVGSVTLSAREWASLRPGDVLETGLRLSEPAVLRIAGHEVARGELVSVEGELGVRIREIVRVEPSG